jgi:hypothetical protein
MAADHVAAGTLVQDGKVFYEMGKYSEAETKLAEALRIDPGNTTASYYLDLIKQDRIHRDMIQHNTDTQERMEHVEKQWILPETAPLPKYNPYATNEIVFTGPGRQAIMSKLDHMRLDSISFDGVPLSEVLKQLSERCRSLDPERRGINFLINNNPDNSGPALGAATAGGMGGGMGGGFGGGGGAAPAAINLDPQSAMPVTPGGEAGGGGEQVDVGSTTIKIPSLTDVRLADVLDAIVLVADHPIKYSIQDFAVVFSAKGAQTPTLFMRTFRVDPNTFYSGLENVSAQSFGAVNSSGSSGSSGGGGGSSQNNNGAVVGVVNAFSGAGSMRSTGGSGGGGGGGGSQGGSGSLLNSTGGNGGGGANSGIPTSNAGGGGQQNQGGLAYITTQTSATTPSALARAFFTALGVNLLYPPGKSVFFNDRLGYLFVKATESDLDTIERAIQVLNQVPPQVHIKARFIEVSQSDDKQLGFDWYLGQFNLGNQAVAQGGNPGSLTVPSSAANPIGAFPGATAAQTIADGGQSLFNSGLGSSSGSTTATITGIMTNPNFQVVLHALESRTGVETLGEPEVTTTSGRQTQMRATSVVTVVIGLNFQQGASATTSTGASGAAVP